MSTSACSILILAGGRGQRLGGRDKGLEPWRDQPLIAHLHRVVRPFTDDLIIACNRNTSRYAAYADRLVHDDTPDFPGPLAGIRAGLAIARHDWLLVLACDTPRLDAELVEALLAARPCEQQPVMIRQGEQWQPLFSVIPLALRQDIEHAWEQGERSLMRILLQHRPVPLDIAPTDPRLGNFNTPDCFL